MTSQNTYNFIIQLPQQYYGAVFGDAARCDYAAYLDSFGRSLPERLVRRVIRTVKLPLPFHRALFRIFCMQYGKRIRQVREAMGDPGRPLCFILYRDYLSLLEDGLFAALREHFPGSRVVVFFTDIIPGEGRAAELLRQGGGGRCADLMCTYDPLDARTYGIPFHNLPMSDIYARLLPAENTCDVLYIGRGKDRLGVIAGAWRYLTGLGLRCSFFLIGVSEKNRKGMPSGIVFCDYMPYERYMKLEAGCRIILEIMQEGAAGNTLRVGEAIVLGKKLLTNNRNLVDNALYDPHNMFVFNVPGDIPEAFLLSDAAEYPREIRDRISLHSFLRDIEEDLKQMEQTKTNEL